MNNNRAVEDMVVRDDTWVARVFRRARLGARHVQYSDSDKMIMCRGDDPYFVGEQDERHQVMQQFRLN